MGLPSAVSSLFLKQPGIRQNKTSKDLIIKCPQYAANQPQPSTMVRYPVPADLTVIGLPMYMEDRDFKRST